MKEGKLLSPEEFKARRENLGLSKRGLAHLWGVTHPWIYYIESGERNSKKWMDLAFKALEMQDMMGGD